MSKYKELKKITSPVLIYIKGDFCEKYRVLFPDGSCIYAIMYDNCMNDFNRCCFNFKQDLLSIDYNTLPSFKSLEEAINQMKKYDERSGNKIIEITKL